MSRPPLPGGPYLVIGLARSGVAAALALRAHGETVLGCDRAGLDPASLSDAGVEIIADPLAALERVRAVVKSPGVPASEPLLAAARERGLAVLGELEVGWRLLEQEFIAVTGTNGKTTTVELLGAVHRACGREVAVAGNVGRALSGLALARVGGDAALAPHATIVCEASSFQLEDADRFAPEAAVLLNLAADHLDRHGDMRSYVAAKLRAFAHQRPGDVAVVPDELDLHGLELPGDARRVSFGTGAGATMRLVEGALWWRGERVIERASIPLRGQHNAENAMAAAAVALERGLPAAGVAEALATFAGVAHRLEEVVTRAGVLYVNDSKGTNVASTLVALRSFEPGRVHAILGGRGKGEDYAPLREEIERRARAVYLIGEAAEEIGAALAGAAGVEVVAAATLARAVALARAAARAGDVVLLSPACTSFDQFADFEARGAEFRALALA